MLCVASEYVAMTTPRLYRAGLSLTPAEADAYLRAQIGTRYPAGMVSLLRRAKTTECLRLHFLRIINRLLSRPRLISFPRRVLETPRNGP